MLIIFVITRMHYSQAYKTLKGLIEHGGKDLYKNWGIITKFLIVMPFVMSVTDIINVACSM